MIDRAAPTYLTTLPVEVLGQVTSNLKPNSIQALARTCRTLNNFVNKDGWRDFVKNRYPTYEGRPLWNDAAHSLTRLESAWETRALNAYNIVYRKENKVQLLLYDDDKDTSTVCMVGPGNAQPENVPYMTSGRPRTSRQAMDFQPVIDVAEAQTGSAWADREERLVIGAGPEILIRDKYSGRTAAQEHAIPNNAISIDDYGQRHRWRSLRNSKHMDGPDDITAIKLMAKGTGSDDAQAPGEILVGRASGCVERITYPVIYDSEEHSKSPVSKKYSTYSEAARLMDLLPVNERTSPHFFAVGLGNTRVSLYNADVEEPLSSIHINCSGTDNSSTIDSRYRARSRTWALSFLGADSLVVGHGVSRTPLQLFAVRPEGIDPEPLRDFRPAKADAVYSVAPMPETAGLDASGSIVFASGSYAGYTRVHDRRSPEASVLQFLDVTDYGNAVYNVMPVLPHLVLAGLSRHHKVNLYDLRYPLRAVFDAAGYGRVLDSEYPVSNFWTAATTSWRNHRYPSGSTYALVRAGPFSPTFYQSIEGRVLQFDAFSSVDPFPDPIFSRAAAPSKPNLVREEKHGSLTLQYRGDGLMDYTMMLKQRAIGHVTDPQKRFDGLDDRWFRPT